MNQIFNFKISNQDFKGLARVISLVENEVEGYEEFMQSLIVSDKSKVIGITGPPGAGKSTLTDALIEGLVLKNKRVAVICVDPSSPFNLGAILGDRIRMSEWFNHPNVFIRSLATRGSLGGLNPKAIEISDILKAAAFDYIIVETVGVGQSEIEISGLADKTIVVLVPESGDEIQTMKSGVMEIADIFVVNKSDRPGADIFIKNLRQMLMPSFKKSSNEIPVIKTIASKKSGIDELIKAIEADDSSKNEEKKILLLAEKAYHLIRLKRMKNVDKEELIKKIKMMNEGTTIYEILKEYS